MSKNISLILFFRTSTHSSCEYSGPNARHYMLHQGVRFRVLMIYLYWLFVAFLPVRENFTHIESHPFRGEELPKSISISFFSSDRNCSNLWNYQAKESYAIHKRGAWLFYMIFSFQFYQVDLVLSRT